MAVLVLLLLFPARHITGWRKDITAVAQRRAAQISPDRVCISDL